LTAKTRGISRPRASLSRPAAKSKSNRRHSDQLSQSLVNYCRIHDGMLQPRETEVSAPWAH
jgi:hypothetical protein